jgi:hypothetical protein
MAILTEEEGYFIQPQAEPTVPFNQKNEAVLVFYSKKQTGILRKSSR